MNASLQLQRGADAVLENAVSGDPRVPGVVAVVTDREGNIYEGAAGQRMLGADAPMSLDTVFAMFSTTKAVTGTAILQLVEADRLDLDAPAKQYAPAIGALAGARGLRRRRGAETQGSEARHHDPHAAAPHGRLRL